MLGSVTNCQAFSMASSSVTGVKRLGGSVFLALTSTGLARPASPSSIWGSLTSFSSSLLPNSERHPSLITALPVALKLCSPIGATIDVLQYSWLGANWATYWRTMSA